MRQTIDRYVVERELARGGAGIVYLAQDPKLGRPVAIKVLHGAANIPKLRERFQREARVIASLKHPNIVELFDYSGEDAEDLFLVMEYVSGSDLYWYLAENGPMSETTTLCIGHEIARALEHAHALGVVHRDLKPENVLLDGGRLVLSDFGVVKEIATEGLDIPAHNAFTEVVGTPGLMAPEQLEGRGIGPAADLFAFGAVLYNLATDRLPFRGDSPYDLYNKILKGKYPDPREHNPLLSKYFVALIKRCLEPKPKKRLASAVQARRFIGQLLRSHGINDIRGELAAYQAEPLSHTQRQQRRHVAQLEAELKLAVSDRNESRVMSLVRHITRVAPGALGRLQNISGLHWSHKNGPRLAPRQGEARGWRRLMPIGGDRRRP